MSIVNASGEMTRSYEFVVKTYDKPVQVVKKENSCHLKEKD